MKRSQISIEFIFMIAIVVLFFIGLLALFGNRLLDITKSNEEKAADDVSEIILDELNKAETAENGYIREFELPAELAEKELSLAIDDNSMLIINLSEKSYIYPMPMDSIGGICINHSEQRSSYEMKVMKQDDVVSISASPDCLYSYYECDIAERLSQCDDLESAIPGFKDKCCKGHCRCCD